MIEERKEGEKKVKTNLLLILHPSSQRKIPQTTTRFYSQSLPMTALRSIGSLWSSPRPGHLAESITWRLLEHCRTIRPDAQAFIPHGAATNLQP